VTSLYTFHYISLYIGLHVNIHSVTSLIHWVTYMLQNVYTSLKSNVTECIYACHPMYIQYTLQIYIGIHMYIHWVTYTYTLHYISCYTMYILEHVTECIRQIVTQCIYQMYIKCCTMYIGVYTSGPRGLYITVHSIYITVFLDIRPRCRLSNAITVHANIHYSACQYTLGIYIG